jgi:hypothetical protein
MTREKSLTMKESLTSMWRTVLSPPQHIVNDDSKGDAVVDFLRLEARALSSGTRKEPYIALERALYPP